MILNEEQRLHAETAFAQSLNVVHHAYVDISGDLIAGALLGQILYWLAPSKNGEPRAQIQKDGHYWIAKTRADWWQEIRISPKQYDRAIKILKDKNFVEVKTMKFDGNPTTHICVIPDAINAAVESWKIEQVKTLFTKGEEPKETTVNAGYSQKVNNEIDQRETWEFAEGKARYLQKGKNEINLSGISSYTEITTENLTESTTDIESEFAKIWSHYPKKQGKVKALKAFKKALAGEGLKKENGQPYTVEEILVKVVLFKQYINKSLENGEIEQRFVPTGGNWFTNESWADSIPDISAKFEDFEDAMNYSLTVNKLRLMAEQGREYRPQIEEIVQSLPY